MEKTPSTLASHGVGARPEAVQQHWTNATSFVGFQVVGARPEGVQVGCAHHRRTRPRAAVGNQGASEIVGGLLLHTPLSIRRCFAWWRALGGVIFTLRSLSADGKVK